MKVSIEVYFFIVLECTTELTRAVSYGTEICFNTVYEALQLFTSAVREGNISDEMMDIFRE